MTGHRPRFDATLGVVTHVPHWPDPANARPWAYEPYVREMNVWGRLFRTVEICAPVSATPAQGNNASYEVESIRWRPVRYSLANGGLGRVHRLVQMPGLVRALHRLIRDSDLVLLRSPGHPALVARILAQMMGKPSITKWAGLFGVFPGIRFPSRLEHWLVRRGGDPVLVYGPADRPHLISFLPALMTVGELERADALATGRRWDPPWRILSVGRLLPVKGFDLALRGLGRLREIAPDLPWTFTLVGDGPEDVALRSLAADAGIADRVTFAGAKAFEEVQKAYAQTHVVIMPGVKEGWPKTIAEAWAHGAVPVAAAAGIVPWIVDGKGAGCTFEPTPDGLANALHTILSDVPGMCAMSRRGRELAADLSLDAFAARLERILIDRYGLR